MRVREAAGVATAILLALLVTGCASTLAPQGWLPTAAAAGGVARGGWIVTHGRGGAPDAEVMGELIAIGLDSVFIQTPGRFVALPMSGLRSAQVAGYRSGWQSLVGWSVVGTLATASHGLWLIISAPLWILTGTLASSSASHAGIVRHPSVPWEELRAYARFPQGLPPDFPRTGSVLP